MDIRVLEKNKKTGYIFYVSYRGSGFDAFDEMAGKTTVKGYFKEIMNSLGFTWAKGIQQGGRTDAKLVEIIVFMSAVISLEMFKK